MTCGCGSSATPPRVLRGLGVSREFAPAGAAPLPEGDRVLLVDKPDSLQTYYRFGNRGIDWSHPDYPARKVANTVLGGRFTGRLNTALRIEGGLTYGAYSWFEEGIESIHHLVKRVEEAKEAHQ